MKWMALTGFILVIFLTVVIIRIRLIRPKNPMDE